MNQSEDHAAPLPISSLIGTRLGDFQVMRKLGRGGMADVYAARQISLGRDVALKILRADHAKDQDYVARFRREARAAAKLNHPNIVQVYEVGSIDSMHYIAQELIEGENLRERIDRVGVLDADTALEVLIGVGAALKAATESGITHRDIKPENIMQSSNGLIKVTDFGLARFGTDVELTGAGLTKVGLTMGTPRYMSPEQVQGKAVDVRSDLYSLGVTMYHLLCGRPPFEADEPLALALMHLQETPIPLDRARISNNSATNPDIPEWLVGIVHRLMSKPVDSRFQSANELIDAIRDESPSFRLDNLGPGTAAATIRLQRATDRARIQSIRKPLRWAFGIGLPLAMTALAAWLTLGHEGKQVEDILRPRTVAQSDTVQEQYLNAVIRGDEMGWESVGQYFPPEESATNAAYYAKAQLQLARQLAETGELERADEVLSRLRADPNVDRIYHAISLARQYSVLQSLGRTRGIAAVKQQFRTLYSELEANNPSLLSALDQVISKRELLQLGVAVR